MYSPGTCNLEHPAMSKSSNFSVAKGIPNSLQVAIHESGQVALAGGSF